MLLVLGMLLLDMTEAHRYMEGKSHSKHRRKKLKDRKNNKFDC